MPGYDRKRFKNLRNDDEHDFICGICQDVFNTPVVVPCCRQTYCDDCISQWLTEHQTCPNDRSNLDRNSVIQPPVVFMNLLARLRIDCDYSSVGCDQVCQLDQLSHHLSRECHYNPDRKCQNCGAVKESDDNHNCMQNLYSTIRSLADDCRHNRQMQQLFAIENENCFEEISKLRSDIEKLKKDNEELTNNENLQIVRLDSLSEEFKKLFDENKVLREELHALRSRIEFGVPSN